MTNNNITVQVYKHISKFKGALIPLHNGEKRCKVPYKNNKFNINDFLSNDVSGIGLILSRVNDLICIDIDNNTAIDLFLSKVPEFKEKGIYMEQSPKGLHIFMKVQNREEFISIIHSKFGGRFIANKVEIFPDFGARYVVIAPSIVTSGKYKSICGDITEVKYVEQKYIFELIEFIREKIGTNKPFHNKIVSKNSSKVISSKIISSKVINNEVYDKILDTLLSGKYSELLAKSTHRRLRQILYSIEKILINNKGLLSGFLESVGIKIEDEQKKAYRVRSIIVDDGKNPDAYIFKDKLIYYDFHFSKCNIQLLQYLIIDRPRECLKWLLENMPALFINVLEYVKKIVSKEDLKWLYEQLINTNDKSISMFRKVVKRNKNLWLKGNFKQLSKLAKNKYMSIKSQVLVSKIRKFSKIKHILGNIITVTENKAQAISRLLKFDFDLFKHILEGLGFRYYKKHKRFVRINKEEITFYEFDLIIGASVLLYVCEMFGVDDVILESNDDFG